MEKLKKLIRSAIGNTLPQHQAARLTEQIATYLNNEECDGPAASYWQVRKALYGACFNELLWKSAS